MQPDHDTEFVSPSLKMGEKSHKRLAVKSFRGHYSETTTVCAVGQRNYTVVKTVKRTGKLSLFQSDSLPSS